MASSSSSSPLVFGDSLERKTVLALVAGATVGAFAWPAFQAAIAALRQAASTPDAGALEERSTTSSAGGGAAAYETRKAVDEYVQFHFAAENDLLPYAAGPKLALNFTGRLAQLCKKFCARPGATALDMGCAVGGASFELARHFEHVLGIDYSHAFIAAAQDIQRSGTRQYEAVVEGDVRQTCSAVVPKDIHRGRVTFQQGDACAIPDGLPHAPFDVVLAANLLCRLPDPMLFLNRLPALIKPGGVAVLVSPYSWLPGWTPKEHWLGGKLDAAGKPVRSADALAAAMKDLGFELVHQEDMPFLIREHVRKFQWGCSHACVWRRRS